MNTDAQLKQMQEYTAKVLESTNQFRVIDPGYNFKNLPTRSPLRQDTKRHIYCEIKPEFVLEGERTQFLILTHPDVMDGPLFAKKIEQASMNDIYVANMLFRYINSSDESTQGPLFRRFLLEEEREKTANYHKQAAFARKSLSLYSAKERNNFRILKDIENYWANILSDGFPVYYQPQSTRLKEMIKVYKWGGVFFRRFDELNNPYSERSKTIKNPLLVENLNFFTLQPQRHTTSNAKTKFGFANSITEIVGHGKMKKASKFRFNYDGKLLLADFVSLPNVETERQDEEIARHFLGVFAKGLENRITNKSGEEVRAILKNTLTQIPEDAPVQDTAQDLRNLYAKIKNGAIPEVEERTKVEITIPSFTEEALDYLLSWKKVRDEVIYTCRCRSFIFSKKDNKNCKHIDYIKELDEFSK